MTIRVWQAFSCNNSSSYRLVARFADEATAREIGDELETFFAAHAREMDELPAFPRKNPATAQSFAKQHGFQWDRVITWGDGGLAGDEPDIFVEDNVLLVYHGYCGGGFGLGIQDYLKQRGASSVDAESNTVSVSLLFARQPEHVELERELDAMFGQIEDDMREVEPFVPPWDGDEAYGTASFFRDEKTVGLYFPIEPNDLAAMKQWLASRGIERYALSICEAADDEKFARIARARCTACEGPLEYLTPKLHDIETEQLACRPCGGFYELSAFDHEEARP